ncbi:MAG TPA: helix-turn-helix transcriptional regulator [Pirellulales bacterium]|nr:helix-turn-helix transcriptional regulator [Pirellulales bacterium]
MTINKKQLGDAVRSVRKLRNMTQADLAEKVGMATNSGAILERGERAFTMNTLNALARALDVPAACLAVLGTPSPGPKQAAAANLLAKLQTLIPTIVAAEQQERAKARPKKGRGKSRPNHPAAV